MENLKKILREELNKDNHSKIKKLELGISIVCDDLKIERPEIEYIDNPNYTSKYKSFAAYSPSEKKVYVVIYNRNTADIMRSIAHELRHYKQDLDGVLHEKSGEDGDEFENEANAYSGKIMRRIGREVEGIFESVNKPLLSEDFDTQEEMIRLSNDVLKSVIKKAVNYFVFSYPNVLSTYVGVFQNLPQKYNKLNEFLKSYHMRIVFDEGNRVYFLPMNVSNGSIVLEKYTKDFIENTYKICNDFVKNHSNIDDATDEEITELYRDVYFAVYSERMILSIAHELQHAYDSWRSKHKAFKDKASNKYYSSGNKNFEDMDEETYTKYLKLHHEINARFTQAIAKSRLIEIVFTRDDPNRPFGYQYAIPINDFIKSFKLNFVGYNVLTPKQQKYVLRRASQYYHAAKEKYDGKIKGKD